MWKWKLFDSLDGLLAFVNEHGLTAAQFKVVNSPAPRRSSRYGTPVYLIYLDPPAAAGGAALTAAEAFDLAEEKEHAIGAAEDIIHGRSGGARSDE